jgi:hypothetical protein
MSLSSVPVGRLLPAVAAHQTLLVSRRWLSRKSPKQEEEEPQLSLTEALSVEIQEESANDEVDQEYVEAHTAMLKKYKISDEVGSSVVKLSRTRGAERIEISFNCQDEEEDFDNESFDEESESDDSEAESSFGINFEVNISKEKLGSMSVKCIASSTGDIVVKHVQYVPEGKSIDDVNLYEGPRFDQLSDTLQGAVEGYLADRDIDGDVSYFILAHSAQKEQKEYENWLHKYVDS